MMPSPPPVGKRIKEIRKKHGLSLDDLSFKSAVSKSMLSQIESEQVNPTIATVWKIASGLGIKLQSLLEGKDEPEAIIHVTRFNEGTILDSRDGGTHFHVLSSIDFIDDLELYLLDIQEGACLDSEAHFPGTEEYLTVIQGKVRVTSGKKSVDLEEGDFVIYSVDVNHSIENLGNEKARVHLVVRFPGNRQGGS